jgi:hypothetical protein
VPSKLRVLIASQPAAWLVLREMLEEVMDLVPAHTVFDALTILQRDPAGIALVISTIAFDDSRMMELLYAAKSNPTTGAVPFICCRVLPTIVLSEDSVLRVAQVCRFSGAADFIDIPTLDQPATAAFRAALLKHIGTPRAAT